MSQFSNQPSVDADAQRYTRLRPSPLERSSLLSPFVTPAPFRGPAARACCRAPWSVVWRRERALRPRRRLPPRPNRSWPAGGRRCPEIRGRARRAPPASALLARGGRRRRLDRRWSRAGEPYPAEAGCRTAHVAAGRLAAGQGTRVGREGRQVAELRNGHECQTRRLLVAPTSPYRGHVLAAPLQRNASRLRSHETLCDARSVIQAGPS